jgi:SNF2 family DNA or RNA helicase
LANGQVLSEPLALVRLLRLHQITSNYVPTEDEGTEPTVEIDPGQNMRLSCLMDLLEDIPHQAIIWARFTQDINQIMDALDGNAVRYDGQVGEDQRAENKRLFQEGKAKFFVGNAQAGAEGLSLKMAKSVIYYNNSFRLIDRLQSEDRAHGIGQDQQVGYYDIIAEDTVDLHICKNLVKKVNLSNIILGDKIREWL